MIAVGRESIENVIDFWWAVDEGGGFAFGPRKSLGLKHTLDCTKVASEPIQVQRDRGGWSRGELKN